MEEVHIDTGIISEVDNDIIKVINGIETLLEEVFKLIEKMPTETGEWKGISAEKFVTLANADSKNYYLLKDNLSDLSAFLGKYCLEMNSVMNEVMR